MNVLKTERLTLRHLELGDADFILQLLNEPGFLQYIGDRGVRTADDARRYIETVPIAHYAQHGFGLYGVELKDNPTLIGMCGLIKRDGLADVDIGYAILSRYGGQGYAYEAASAVLHYGYTTLNLNRIVAFVAPDNERSIHLLEKLGLRFEGMMRLPGYDHESKLFIPQP